VIAAIIGARVGSKSIPDKNMALLGGKPLLVWAIEAANTVRSIQHIFVSSDSKDYLDVASHYGAIPITRPPALARDESGDFEWVSDLASKIKEPQTFVLLRPTTPIRGASHILGAIAHLKLTSEATGLRSVHVMPESAWKCGEVQRGFLVPLVRGRDMNQPRQMYPPTFKPNGYVDVIKRETIEAGSLYGDRVLAYITDPAVEVDSIEELEFLRWKVQGQKGESHG